MGETKWGSAAKIHLGLDLSGGVSITYQVVDGTSPTTEEMEDAVYKLQQRVYAYSTEAQVVQEGTDRINIQIPGVMDTEEILTDLGKPGTLEFVTEDGETVMEGAQVTGAEAGMGTDDSGNLTYSVVLTLSDEGAKAIAQATAEHQNESIRILYNGEELTTAVITKQITDGECAILGLGTMAEAERLASSIRIGSLQIELEELSSTVVSPQLGTRAIQTSVQAAFVGLALVIFLMMYTYRLPGIVAGFALVFYTCLDLIALSMTGVTLTLPGIAGIILSIGMAVDANVVIYMRIREEITMGLSVKDAILSGYKLALGAILDGNITTLMAGCILYYVGSGPIHGFAVTLMSGIVLSMFTALVITRILIRALYSLGFQQEKWYGRLHDRKLVRFTKGKKWIVPVTIVVILSGPLTMAAHAQTGQNILNFSMDFTGGTQMTLYLNQDITQEELEEVLKPVYAEVAGEENIQVSLEESVDAESNVATVRTAMLTSRQCSQLSDELAELGLAEAENIEFDTVSATITNETRAMSILAVMLALIAMLVYLHFRFRDGCFAVSAILALVHDVLVVLACYAVFRIPVGSSFIACMLTIVGYSINATIVVFDRIRENQKDGLTRQEYVDVSISQTMSRNIYTSLTTIVMVLVLYVHGVESIREFALPIIVGIIAGTWSSICLTGNLWNQLTTLEEEMDLFYDHFLDRIGIGKYFDE
ncbi:MAG: protein translocase subunit SecD [Clostridiales bacterium]|nr:protein translocase subunit SecD [Clostridiales bacterium]